MPETSDVTRGPAVSGRPWKKVQTHRTSAILKQPNKKSWETRNIEKLKLKQAKELEAELKNAQREKRRMQNEKRRLKEERKKEQRVRHAIAHQGAVYIKSTKVKKLDLKARKQLMKAPPELLMQRFGRQKL